MITGAFVHSRLQTSKEMLAVIEVIMGDVDGYLGELGKEMRGVAEYWQVDLGIVVGINLIYELRRVRSAIHHL